MPLHVSHSHFTFSTHPPRFIPSFALAHEVASHLVHQVRDNGLKRSIPLPINPQFTPDSLSTRSRRIASSFAFTRLAASGSALRSPFALVRLASLDALTDSNPAGRPLALTGPTPQPPPRPITDPDHPPSGANGPGAARELETPRRTSGLTLGCLARSRTQPDRVPPAPHHVPTARTRRLEASQAPTDQPSRNRTGRHLVRSQIRPAGRTPRSLSTYTAIPPPRPPRRR